MIEKDYLPQYAAEAVRDLEGAAKQIKELANVSYGREQEQYSRIYIANLVVADLLRRAEHVVLPPNGEIYRDSKHTGPTDQECASLTGLPAPITSFEFAWTHSMDGDLNPTYDYQGEKSQLENPPKRIVIAMDEKQLYPEAAEDKDKTRIGFYSVCYYESIKKWTFSPHSCSVFDPFVIYRHKDKKGWATECTIFDILTAQYLDNKDVERGAAVFSEYQADISVVVQACHALRVGAVLESRKEKSYTRTRTLEKQGVGGFEYHVLRLPHGTVKETLGSRCGGGERDGPRYHFRRAHLRNLSKGTQTFVRSCFVGNRDKGVVEKNYELNKEVAA
jgi:hypothetical protein